MCPKYEGKPLIVLSNNDGCAIARTHEAKQLGVKMGDPWFKISHLERTHGLIALSANFALYADLSDRMMNVISEFSPEQEIYSIDESFVNLTGINGEGRDLANAIKLRVKKWVGIPTCVGIGSTKTLAKLANYLAKRLPKLEGVCDLSTLKTDKLMRAIRHVPIEDVWGVGRKLAPQLQKMGILTAAHLAETPASVIKNKFSIVLAKTARELAGDSCIPWEESPPEKQQIMRSASFGQPISEITDLQNAIAAFTAEAMTKLRTQRSFVSTVHIFIATSPFRAGPKHNGSMVIRFNPTNSTRVVTHEVIAGIRRIYRKDFKYMKAGVCLLDIISETQQSAQLNIFEDRCETLKPRDHQLMSVIDTINHRYGRRTVQMGMAHFNNHAQWLMKQERMTPAYTTSWEDIIQLSH